MRNVVSVENMRKSDAATIAGGVAGAELMLRAGKGIFDTLVGRKELRDVSTSVVYIICGSGNNAGDGYVLAMLLKEAGIGCEIILSCDKFSEDGKYYYDKCIDAGVDIYKINENCNMNQKNCNAESETGESATCVEYLECIESYLKSGEKYTCIIVDCLLGTGFKGVPREPIKSIIEDINAIKNNYCNRVSVVSVDINSGLNGDNGLCEVCVKSDLTISIGDLKPGLMLNSAKDYIGEIVNIDIGITPIDKPMLLMEESDIQTIIPDRKNNSNKGTYGYVALIGGSARYSGAIRLAYMANAAMRSGAGVVFCATPKSIAPLVIPNILESTIYPLSDKDGEAVFNADELDDLIKRCRTIAFGMGIGQTEETSRMLEYLLCNYKGTIIIDADGLNCLAKMDGKVLQNTTCSRVILTPHLKEFSRLSGNDMESIKNNPIELAMNYARENHVIVLLKGPTTIVTDGDDVILTDRGCPGMATAGSGDVLSGILAAVCAYCDGHLGENHLMYVVKDPLMQATALGAYINGRAGEIAQKRYGAVSMIASDTVNCIPEVIKGDK